MPTAYTATSRHPLTGEWEEAEWFQKEVAGRHFVRFSDGEIFDTRETIIPVKRRESQASVDLSDEQPAKEITEVEHSNGRKDVVVKVNTLDVEVTDDATAKAKEVIEKEVFPILTNADVVVVVSYRHPVDGEILSAWKTVKIPHVRNYAEACVQSFIKQFVPDAVPADFMVVEYYKLTDEVKVTTLDVL